MTETQALSAIQNVDLREVWPNEATDFTPWLAENISKLGEALGLELELQSREAPIGPYSLDLLAHDRKRGRPVIIENQLGTTDHTHLGQLLTYASGYDAHVAVWIAKEFRDEHRQALDWLNQRSDKNTKFFGVEIELWKIGDSLPAPYFKLVATPNNWRKEKVTTNKRENVSEKRAAYQPFFQGLIDALVEKKFTNPLQATPTYEQRFSSGFSLVIYRARFDGAGNANVDLYLDRDKEWNKKVFDHLLDNKDDVESTLGESLEWDRLDGGKASRITVRRPGTIEDDPEILEEIQDWMIDKLLKFKKVFGPRLKDLDTL